MTNDVTKGELKPLHVRVCDANPGDVGWCWFDGGWCAARILDVEEEGDYIVVITDDQSEWFSLHDNAHPVAMAPWIPIPEPRYGGGEDPDTHAVTFQSAGLTWTFSWRSDEAEGKAISQRVSDLLHGLLVKEPQP
jgi:hypothetical protein